MTVEAGIAPATGLGAFWKRPAVRGVVYQAALAAALIAAGAYVWLMLSSNLPRLGLKLGLDFLTERATFEVGINPIGYKAGDTVLKAFAAGLANTILVSILAIGLTTVFGTALALARLSTNLLLARLARLYVDVIRNIPLLLQLLFWQLFIVHHLPIPRQALQPLPGVFLSNRGLLIPFPVYQPALWLILGSLVLGIALAWWLQGWGKRYRERTQRNPRAGLLGLAAAIGLPVLAYLLFAEPIQVEVPELRGFNFRGGITLSPEFAALLIALVAYHTAFAGEVIRSGILGVDKGQLEAARSLGLKPRAMLRLVVLPQALRIVVPPLTSLYLSVTKNSSLAVAIGYPDLVRVSTVVTSDTGRALECAAIVMTIYLGLSLLTALYMNWYNRRIALKGGLGR